MVDIKLSLLPNKPVTLTNMKDSTKLTLQPTQVVLATCPKTFTGTIPPAINNFNWNSTNW